ncbi:lipopolysaccharide biosynthesis protein [Arcticibacter tournemirensis]|uniref:Oligosaccharide flippase family protein n=1 Tax=Arcticibacter tournemirensis TaxID=699437 RepID=A0A4Q0M7N5_9SPHI|nr:oligosaccharide flippase family protein [Arcticibacter tournemirensis]RXF69118.1 hypothetical protein EKH83_13265 [Arcticibacter tournemirensis]
MGIFLTRLFNSNIVKSTVLYTIADIIGKGIPFIILPIVTRFLTPSDFGVLTNFNVVTQVLVAVCALNTYSALSVSYHRLDEVKLKSYISNLIYLILILSVVCSFVILIFENLIYKVLGISFLWQQLAVIFALSTSLLSLYTSLLRMQNNVMIFSLFQIMQSFLSAAFAILFVVVFEYNWQGRAVSMVASGSIAALLALVCLMRNQYIFKKGSISQVKDAFFFGLPLLPHTLSFWLKSGVDKIIITNFVGLAANGIFSIALTLGSVIGIFTNSFFNAYTPLMFSDLYTIDIAEKSQGDLLKMKLVRITYLFSFLLFVVCFFSYFLIKLSITLLLSHDYGSAVYYLPFLLLTLFFDGLYSIMSGYIFYKKKTKVLGAITFMSSIVQMLLTFSFVKIYGAIGALYSSSIVSVATFVAILLYSNKLYSLPWFGLKNKLNG